MSNAKIFPYQAQEQLKILGAFKAHISSNDRTIVAKLHVVRGKGGAILGKDTAEKLGLLRVGQVLKDSLHVNTLSSNTANPLLKGILERNATLFSGTGKLKNFQLKLHINPDVTPVQQPIRRIPFHTRKTVEEELEHLQKLDIIEQVNGRTSWVNPLVAVPKKDNKIHLCLDMRRANEAIIRERHIIPKVEDILTELHGAKYFSKLDLREGHHQLELHPNRRDITTFATHKGLFRYKRLIYGVSSEFESFQRQIEIVIAGCPGAKNISDDILVWGTTEEEQNSRLNQVLAQLREAGLKVNKNKCMFCTDHLVFAGHELSPKGISPQKSRIDSIMKMPSPSTANGVRSFLGMKNFCKRYVPNYSTITSTLRLPTKKNQRFTWGSAQQSAFDQLKSSLVSAQVMAFYNPNADTKLIVDGSPIGLGAILTQEQDDGTWRPIAYGSHALDPVQQRYGQTEREALAVTSFCQHFHHYLYDREFTILTDHKLLIHNFGVNSNPPPRIQRWML